VGLRPVFSYLGFFVIELGGLSKSALAVRKLLNLSINLDGILFLNIKGLKLMSTYILLNTILKKAAEVVG